MFAVIQQQAVVPNQEIILDFIDTDVTSEEAQNTISIVKKQLQSIGVKNTRLSQGIKKGQLKITYYSDEDVSYIKGILSKEKNVALGHILYDNQTEGNQDFPSQKKSKDYSLDVHEIQKSTDFSTDLVGKYVLEEKHEQNGYPTFSPISITIKNSNSDLDGLIKTAQKVHTTIALAIDTNSRSIPEVRAGPIS